MLRSIAVACLVTLSIFYATRAQGQVPLGPARYCGIPTFAIPNAQGASASVWNGRPVILIDPSQIGTSAWAHFVTAHECAHHVLGHTLPVGMWFRTTQYWATAAQELEADCWAARRIGVHGADIVSRIWARHSHHAGGLEYPSPQVRARRIRDCAGLP